MTKATFQRGAFLIGVLAFLGVSVLAIVGNSKVAASDTVILATRPVDPRDLFRGDYVILRYVIEEDPLVVAAVADQPDGTPVYVNLDEGPDGVAVVTHATTKQAFHPDPLMIEGVVESGTARFYVLEQYYVPEGAGYGIESLPAGELYVEAAIAYGEARVLRLLDKDFTPITVERSLR